MLIVVISPEGEDSREIPAMSAMFAAGLRRYHVRKPLWSPARLEEWLRSLPPSWRRLLVLHQHHELVDKLGLGGRHFRDEEGALRRQTEVPHTEPAGSAHGRKPAQLPPLVSRSSHDLAPLKLSLGKCDSVLFGPVFPSISKKGYGPGPGFPSGELRKLLAGRGARRKATSILAIGGVSSENLAQCREMGFDGVAVHGAVWGVPNSAGAYSRLRDTAASLGRKTRAA